MSTKLLVLFMVVCSLFSRMSLAQSTMLRLDTEPAGAFTFWVAHETKVGFTAEVLASTIAWAEMDVGWTFHPDPSLTILAMAGVSFEDKSVVNAIPILLFFFQQTSA